MRRPSTIKPSDVAALLKSSATAFIQGCSSESVLLANAVMAGGQSLGAIHFTGIQVPGLNRDSWLANDACRFTTFFMTPELKKAGAAVRFLPFRYADILTYLRSYPFDVALFSVTPPDADGLCSFGPTADFLPDLWERIPLLIAHVNPTLPRVEGPVIPFDRLTAVIEVDAPVPGTGTDGTDELSASIAQHAAEWIDDGSTIQTGLGRLPGSLLRALSDRKRLRIHSGLIGDAVMDLLVAGAIEKGADITAGVAIGTPEFYKFLPESEIRFQPVSYTHDPYILAKIAGLLTVNSVMDVDLFGQGYAESAPSGWNSGPGGATDFAQGARMGGGLRLAVLPSTAKGKSRIVTPGGGRGPVSLARSDIDIVITEFGSADLRLSSHDARAAALISIAHPDHREQLARAWHDGPDQY